MCADLGQHRLLAPRHRAAGGQGRRRRLRRPELPAGPGRALDLPRRSDASSRTRAIAKLGRRRPEERGRHPGDRRRRRCRGPGDDGRCDQGARGARRACVCCSSSAATPCPGTLRGHEHFGFKDGVSQPGVRGKVSAAPGDFITPRYIDRRRSARARSSPSPGSRSSGRGSSCWASRGSTPSTSIASAPRGDATSRAGRALGSYLVCRRLRQDVPAFWKFAIGAAAALGMPARQVRVDAGRPLAERRADHAHAGRRRRRAGGRRVGQQPLHLRRRHAAVDAAADPGLRRRSLRRRRGRTCSARSARTSRTSARATRATSPPISASRTTACCG